MKAEEVHYRRRLFWLIFFVKSFVFAVAYVCSRYAKPYNHSIGLLLNPANGGVPLSNVESIVKSILRPFVSWDGAYFLSIARDGYRFEQQHAFFPLFPLLIKLMANWVLWPFESSLDLTSRCLISGVVLANFFHIMAIIGLYDLSILVFDVPHFSFLAAAFATIYPMQGFLSSVYSESLFMFLTITGLNCFYRKQRVLAAISWSLAGLTRSNGILLPGFFIYEYLHSIRHMSRRKSLIRFFRLLILIAISWSGFVAFLSYGYDIYCGKSVAEERPWCNNFIPNIYSFVQSHYWNVGFLRYFTVHQIPNFLLAAPMTLLCISCIKAYLNVDLKWCLKLGLCDRHTSLTCKKLPFFKRAVLPHVYLLAVMLAYTIFVVHIQIINRLFSFMPIIYWYQAHLYSIAEGRLGKARKRFQVGLMCSLSIVFMILLFTFYPPA